MYTWMILAAGRAQFLAPDRVTLEGRRPAVGTGSIDQGKLRRFNSTILNSSIVHF